VDGGAVEAEEDAVGDGGPGGVLGVAVEAHLVLWLGLEAAEDGVLVGEGIERHGYLMFSLPARGEWIRLPPGRLNWLGRPEMLGKKKKKTLEPSSSSWF